MANEHLQRIPLAEGNRSTYTWSGWIKRNQLGAWERLFSTAGQTMLQLTGSSPQDQIRYFHQVSGNFDLRSAHLLRDVGSWMHIVFSVDHTNQHSKNRVRIYINGAEVDNYGTDSSSNGSQNLETYFNSMTEHGLLGRETTSSGENFRGEAFDIFWVDGQALTPEVFGFYKDGDGYQSSGTDQATDFRSGQWSPRLPKSIKHTINRGGGFGVNGFYLPLNDSSNFGADFHCTPNSIIKLKGEDEPQPRNGAPTTSDAYVSQLREEKGTLGFDGAVKFDGSDDYLEIPHSDDFDFGSGEFTVEAFIEGARGGTSTGSVVLNQSNSGAGSDSAFYFGAGTNGVSLYLTTGTGWNVFITTDVNVSNSGWHHVVWQRRSNTLEIYVDGRLAQTGSFTGTVNNSSRAVDVGRQSSDGSNFNGMISNLRVVKGTAVYTANFTPPTEPLTNVNNTKLLCCNSSTSATAATVIPSGSITANGGAFATRNELSGYIVLAVPGISHPTGSNILTVGTFSPASGWTLSGAAAPTISGNKCIWNGTSGTGLAQRAETPNVITTGNYYIIKFTMTRTAGTLRVRIADGSYSNTFSESGNHTVVVKAGSIQGETILFFGDSFNGTLSDVEIYQQDTIRDYSADINGSGSNKTLTLNGNASVIHGGNGYYGSVMNFDGNGDYFEVDTPILGTGDWTIEEWIKQPSGTASQGYWDVSLGVNGDSNTTGAASIYHVFQTAGSGVDGEISFIGHSNTYRIFGRQDVRDDCWHHVVVEKYNNVVTLYIDGVRKDSASDTHNYNSTNNTMIGASKISQGNYYTGQIQDVRVYVGIAKYKGGFDVPKPYSPQSISTHRARVANSKNNFVTMNPLSKSGCTLSNGNLTVADSSSSGGQVYSTMGSDTGKWYYEAHITSVGGPGGIILGINPLRRPAGNVQNRTGYRSSGDVYNDGGSVQQTGTSYTTGDIIGVAWDADNKKLWFAKNGSWVYSGDPVNGGNQATAYSNAETQGPSVQYDNGAISQITDFNFGQNPTFSGNVTAGTNTDGNGKGLFKYAPPTGFLALCDDNLPTPAVADPGKHFKTVLWKGNGTTGHAITGLGFKPDFVWIFNRDRATYKPIFDTVRGAKNMLRSNQDIAQGTFDTVLQSFDSDGFTVGNDGAHNYDGERLSAWCWKAGGPAVTNNDGSLSSLVSANQEAGFSIVKFTAQTSSSGTVGHGLGKKPAFWIWKDINGATGWYQYHQRMGASAWLQFDAQLAVTGNSAAWGGVEPTDTVFTHGQGLANQNDIIMYIWAEIQGYSKFGNYIGNGGNDGPHVYCGFRPAWVLIKKKDGSGDENWRLFDSSRCPINQNDKHAVISSNGVESTESGIDLLSNGFKVRHTDGHQNQSGSEYIFAAFAESPFQTANAK